MVETFQQATAADMQLRTIYTNAKRRPIRTILEAVAILAPHVASSSCIGVASAADDVSATV